MKKSKVIMLIVLVSVLLLGAVVAVVSFLHGKNEDTKPAMTITATTEAVETASVVTEEYVETTANVTEPTVTETVSEVEGDSVVYGDSNEVLFIPYSALESFESFMGSDGVLEMLGSLLFDIEVEWDPTSFVREGNKMLMRGDCVNADGYVEFHLDFTAGTADISTNIKTTVSQTRDDFTKLSNSYVHTFSPGSSLSDVNAETITTQEVKLKEFADFDGSAAIDLDGVSQTLDVVLNDYNAASDMKYAIVYYLRRFFGSGTIDVWDYERHENSTVTFYVSINGWNVTIRTRGGDPYVIYAAANPSNSGPLFNR